MKRISHRQRYAGILLGLASAVVVALLIADSVPLARSPSEHLRQPAREYLAPAPTVVAEQKAAAARRMVDAGEEDAPVRGTVPPGAASAPAPYPSPRPEPPDGYSFAPAPLALHKTAYDAEAESSAKGASAADAEDELNWLFADPDAIAAARQRAHEAGRRDWLFGWLRLADGAKADDLGVTATDVEVLGRSGRLLRVKLPAREAPLNALLSLEAVDGVGVMPTSRKAPAAFVDVVRSRPGEQHPVFVTLMADDPKGRLGRQLQALGAVVGRFDADTRAYAASVDADSLEAVVLADFTLAVEPVGGYRAAHDTLVPGLGADGVRFRDGAPGIFRGTAGGSVPIGVADTGLNTNHLDIVSHRESVCGASFVTNERAIEDADLWVDADGHGTHVTGTFAGNGFAQERFAGIAPAVAHIRFAKVLNRYGGGWGSEINRGMDYLARPTGCTGAGQASAEVKPLIVNMSLAASGRYWRGRTLDQRKLDAIIWAHRQLYVVANANSGEGGFSDYAAAKNSLAVGATVDSGEVTSWSSRGPTFDGRLAPQVVAIGNNVDSAEGGGSRGGYVGLSGTSMASPAVAGVAALLMDAVPGHGEHPALSRARLMASAIRPDVWLDAENAFPADNSRGPGVLQAKYGLGKVSAHASVLQREAADGWTTGAASASMEDGSYGWTDIVVPQGATRLDLAMTWDEPPADTIGSTVLNDLDLYLDEDGDCQEAACGEYSSRSRVDNVEWIIVRDPVPGTYRVKVVPHRIYTAAPRAGLAWSVIRGESTPNLRIAIDAPRASGSSKTEVAVTITTDSYVASGVRLNATCRYASGDSCVLDYLDVEREDGVLRETVDAVNAELGEIVVGEQQKVVLSAASVGRPARIYVRADAWNALPASASVAVRGEGDAEDPPAEVPATANDMFASASRLGGGSGSVDLDLSLATVEPGEPAMVGGASARPGGSLWYEWTAPTSGPTRFGLARNDAHSTADPGLDVFAGDQLAELDRLVSQPWGGSFFAEQGTTYRVRVSLAHFHGSHALGAATLRWAQGPRPANDDFAAATLIEGVEGEAAGSNFGATLEPLELFGELAATVWYQWSAPEDGDWLFSSGEDDSSVLVFLGDDIASLRLMSDGDSNYAYVSAKAGTRYRIVVASRDAFSAGRDFTLAWEKRDRPVDDNDDFANAELLEGANGTQSVFAGSGVERDEPEQSGVRTRWWVWQALSGGRFAWRLDNSVLRLAVFAADAAADVEDGDVSLAALQAVATATGAFPELAFDASEGTRYWISVGYDRYEQVAFSWYPEAGQLTWGQTPANDDRATPALIESPSGSSTVSGLYATVEQGEQTGALGRSSLWWQFTPASAGWVRFWVEYADSATLAVYRLDTEGGLHLLAKNVGGWRSPDVWEADALFSAEANQRYLVRLGVVGEPREATLRWAPADAPAWLRYAGATGLGVPMPFSRDGKMAFEDRGQVLYMTTSEGLHVFRRDTETGALIPSGEAIARIGDVDFGNARALLWNADRQRLYVNTTECAWRRLAPTDDSRLTLQDDGALAVAENLDECQGEVGWALLHPSGSFLYFQHNGGIAMIDLSGGDGETSPDVAMQWGTEETGQPILNVAFGDDHLYADEGNGLRVFAVDQETGALTDDSNPHLYLPIIDLAVGGNGRFLFAITATGDIELYALDVPTEPAHVQTRWSFVEDYRRGPCQLAVSRVDGNAIDAFCTNNAFVVALRTEAEDASLIAADYVAKWQSDRFNNLIPEFRANEVVTTTDGRYAYLYDRDEARILYFERVWRGGSQGPDDMEETATGPDGLAPTLPP